MVSGRSPRAKRRVALRNAVLIGLLMAGMTSACRNACQSTCVQLADFTRDCGQPVPDTDIDLCLDNQQDKSAEDLDTCREFGSREALQSQLTCDDLVLLWGDVAQGGNP